MNRVKVTILHPGDPLGFKVGGIETFIRDFIKNAPSHFDIDFVGISTDREKCKPGKWIKLDIGGKPFNFFPLFFEEDANKKSFIPLSLRYSFRLKMSNLNFDHHVLFFNRLEPAILFRNKRVPKFLITHNDIEKQILKSGGEVLWSKFPKLYLKIEDKVFPGLDRIYTVSMSTLDFYCKKYSKWKDKFAFIPTFVDVEKFRVVKITDKPALKKEIARQLENVDPEAHWILFVGRLQKQKNPIRLLEVFQKYNLKDTSSYLLIAGEGNLRKAAENHARELGVEKNVIFLGNVNPNDIVKLYQASDAFLMTSNFEGMPMSVLEALGCGLPVVSNEVGEVSRVVRNNFSGEVVKTVDPGMIAQSLFKVVDNPHVYTASNCVDSIREFTPQKVLQEKYDKMEELYVQKFHGNGSIRERVEK
ncbi:MAG: glycosyl transferase [Nitrospinaceae bacterium]|nr:MAG: glycosyl transferase [Nitrospinaceae bacterium]